MVLLEAKVIRFAYNNMIAQSDAYQMAGCCKLLR
jgi:hypothetical protein